MSGDEEHREPPRELSQDEEAARSEYNRFKNHAERHWRAEEKRISVIKGALTRAKNALPRVLELGHSAVSREADVMLKILYKQDMEEYECNELAWQDEIALGVIDLENPNRVQVPAQPSEQQIKDTHDTEHAKAKQRALNILDYISQFKTGLPTLISRSALANIKEVVSSCENEAKDELWKDYEELIKLQPQTRAEKVAEFNLASTKIKNAAAELIVSALAALPASPTTSTPDTSLHDAGLSTTGASSARSTHATHSYMKRKLPDFKGDLKAFPRWSKERKTVQESYNQDTFILMLNDATPKCDDLLANSDVAECWSQLEAKYGNPRTVSQFAIRSYTDWKPTKVTQEALLIEVAEQHLQRSQDSQHGQGDGPDRPPYPQCLGVGSL